MKKSISIQSFFDIIDVVLIIIISLCFHLARPVNSTRVVYIPKGNIKEIISYLEKGNFDIVKILDTYLLAYVGKPQAGWINMQTTKLSKGDFLYKITTAKAATKTTTIIPGESTYFVLKQLAKEFDLSSALLKVMYERYAPYKEGVFIPETYQIPIGMSEEHLVRYLVWVSQTTYENMAKKIFGLYDKKKWYKYIIIASIIQKEAGNTKEMSLVSSVIYNRLKKGMLLQMDGTLNYGKYSHTKVTPQRIQTDTSRYNTYKYANIPPYPVCIVSVAAIKAAIFPKKSSYLYFVRNRHDKNGGHIFTKSLSAHNQAIKKSQ